MLVYNCSVLIAIFVEKKTISMKASETFHNPAFGHNCAQAVAYKHTQLYANPSTIVEEMKANGGGRAESGLCGALYAAMKACPQFAEQIKEEFVKQAGFATCNELKQSAKVPCPRCVDIADEILAKVTNK